MILWHSAGRPTENRRRQECARFLASFGRAVSMLPSSSEFAEPFQSVQHLLVCYWIGAAVRLFFFETKVGIYYSFQNVYIKEYRRGTMQAKHAGQVQVNMHTLQDNEPPY